MIDVTVIYEPGSIAAKELVPIINSASWSAAAVGGFAEAAFDLPGWHDLRYLAKLTIVDGDVVVWQGRLEDAAWTITGGERRTTVTGFGYRRLLDDVTVKQIWSMREIDWRDYERSAASVQGAAQVDALLGSFDPENPTTGGVRIQGLLQALPASVTRRLVYYRAPSGLTLVRIMGTYTETGTNAASISGYLGSSSDGGNTVTDHTTTMASGTSFNQALVANANMVIIGSVFDASITPDQSDRQDFTNVRILGTSLTEDAAGGFYGGTLLRDLLALVPGIVAGVIEDGSDFTIESLERATRDTAASVVAEIAAYSTREWGVWEDGRFDWRSVDYNQPDYLIDLNQVLSLDLNGTVEDVAKTYYVIYTDAASETEAEASSEATSQRNPFAKQGRTRDILINPGVPMTANTSAQLATRVAAENGAYVPASGQIVLPADLEITGIGKSSVLAAHIRPGCNVLIPELPAEDIAGGRDGRTLLHVSAVEVDLNSREVTLSVDSQSRSIDVLLARLAAVTRTVQTNFR